VCHVTRSSHSSSDGLLRKFRLRVSASLFAGAGLRGSLSRHPCHADCGCGRSVCVTIPAEPLDVREQLLEQLANVQSRDPNVAVEHHLKEGDPSTEILQYAQQIKCDLIVMGTHGRSGLGRLFLGSVAEQVLRKAPCAVLTVKTPVAASASSSDTLQESAIV
jgi:nucleotide-binding universal stress UspA family protein